MNDAEYLAAVKDTFNAGPANGQPVLYCMVGLGGEAGEVVNMAQKAMRGDFDAEDLADLPIWSPQQHQRQKLLDELGGVFWFLHALCWQLGVEPANVRSRSAMKLQDRKRRGTLRGDGDDR